MGKKTPLYENHLQAKAKIVDFAGWDMPLHYGSQLHEHHYVRQHAGVFDVSHMTIVDVTGPGATAYLRYVLANNIDKLRLGKALYTCMLTPEGGVIDDLIVYYIAADFYRLISNSATREKDLSWLTAHINQQDVKLTERQHHAILAIQGPAVREKISLLWPAEAAAKILALKPFFAITLGDYFIARTGYTGEDGFEVVLPATAAVDFWERLLAVDIKPCGLGARDTLRLEAGLNLYGADMDEHVTPLESNLAWTVAFEPSNRDFIGRAALEYQLTHTVKKKFVGLILEEQGVLRNHQKVIINAGKDSVEGEITSGSFSPTLNKGIALARVPIYMGEYGVVEMRGKSMRVQVVQLPFVRPGKKHLVA